MPLGNPIRKQNESRIVSVLATEGQTVFTVQGGYIINQISVFRNGVRLSNSEDFTAGDGSTVTLNNAANIDDRIEFHVFDRFTVQNAIVSAASTQTISGDVVVNGKIFGNLDVPSINTGIVTAKNIQIGVANDNEINTSTGQLTLDSALGQTVVDDRLMVLGISTFTGNINASGGNIVLGDSGSASDDRIVFGAGSDLSVYHNGTDSFIDNSTGGLKILGDEISLKGKSADEVMLKGVVNDTTELYFNNVLRLKTYNGGIDVFSNINATGISSCSGNSNVGGEPPWAQASSNGRSLSISGNTTDGTGLLKLGNGAATTNADFDLARIQFYNGATEVARITGETGDSNNDTGQIMFDTKVNGGSLTERLIISPAGHLLPSTDSTYDIGTSSVRFRNFYADTLYGDGSNLTGISGVSVANQSNNRLITATGTTDALNGESALTFDGTSFSLTGDANFFGQIRFEAGGTAWNTTYARPQIGRQADGELRLGAGSDSSSFLTFYTAPSAGGTLTEKLRIEASGGIKIPVVGTSIPVGGILHHTNNNLYVRGGTSGLILGDDDNTTTIHINDAGYIKFETADGTERMRLDGSGRLMLGTTTEGHAAADELTVASTGSGGITIRTGTTAEGNIYFSDGTSSTAEYRGALTYNQNDDMFTLMTSAVERMRIDSVGALTFTAANNGQIIHSFKNTNSTAGSSAHTIEQWFRFNRSGGGMNHPAAKIIAGKEREWIGGASNQDGYLAFHTTLNENGGAERMRISSGGTVSIGQAGYTQGGAAPVLSLYGSSGRLFKIMNSGAQTTGMQLQNSTTGYGEDAGIQFALLGGGTGYLINQYAGDYAWEIYQKQSGGSNKHIMRVYRDGKIGQQSDTDCLMLSTAQDGSGSNYFLRGSKNSTTPGGGNDVVWIYEDGDIYNTNGTFLSSSDASLKENIVDATSQWNDFKALKFRKFNFKASTGFDTHTQLGLVAQEVEIVSPGLVKDRPKIVKTTNSDGSTTESEDGTTKGLKLSILYMKGMKALQEAMTRIETLEAKVAALEGS